MINSRIKVAAIGNPNNNHFALVRYLRDRGFDADLLLTNAEQDHFHPRCDSYELSYMNFTKQLSWGGMRGFLNVPKSQIIKDLREYDILIGTSLAPAYASRAGLFLDIFDPYGSDIWFQTFYKVVAPHYILQDIGSVFYQRRGIRQSCVIHAEKMDQRYESNLKKYAPTNERWRNGLPMVYAPQYDSIGSNRAAPCTHWQEEFKQIRGRSDLMVIFAARNNWHSAADVNTKGIDTFIRGFHKFCKNHPHLRAMAVFMEYGKDVQKSKELACELGLQDKTAWLPKMYRKDLMVGLKLADICCGQFGISWIQNGTLFEALVAGKPILTWRDDEQYAELANLYPIYNAKTPEQIAVCLEEYIADSAKGRHMGLAGRRWYEEEVVNKTLDKYTDYIERRAKEIGKSAR